ncbi:hypothetical protein FA041_03420 [Escherichia coli]|nr:hypothetical protein [Escherichia coli]
MQFRLSPVLAVIPCGWPLTAWAAGRIKAVVPAQPLDFNVALALVVGSFISAGTLTADFVRFGRNAKLAVLVAMVAFSSATR